MGGFEQEEKSYFTVGGRPGLLPSLPATLTLNRYAVFCFDFIDGIAINSALTENLTIQEQQGDLITSGRYGVDSYWAKIQQIGEWLGFEIPDEDDGRLNIEQLVKDAGPELYEPSLPNQSGASKERPHSTLVDLITSLVSVLFHRGGYHRLPALLPESLRRNDRRLNKVAIDDAVTLQEYWLKQLTAIIGEFPIDLDFKIDGETQNLKVRSISELLSELWSLSLNQFVQGEKQEAYSNILIVQLLETYILSMQTRSIAAANADYLDYQTKEVAREVSLPCTISKFGKPEFFRDSKTNVKVVECVDNKSVAEYLALINLATEIVKAAHFRPIKEDDPISPALDQTVRENDEAWLDFLLRQRNPLPNDRPIEPDAEIFQRGITDISQNSQKG